MFDLLRLPLLQKAELKTPKPEERKPPWNKGVAVGKKKPLSREEVKRLYDMLMQRDDCRELALFTTAIDTMLRSGDLLRLKGKDVRNSVGQMRSRIQVKQGKTGRPVTCILSEPTRAALEQWISSQNLQRENFLFGGKDSNKSLCRRRYQDIVKHWIGHLGLPGEDYGTHSLRRTKSSLLYSETKDSAKVQIVLGQSTLTAAQEYLGVSNDEAIESLRNIRLF